MTRSARSYYYVSTRPAHRQPDKFAAYLVEPGANGVVARITFVANTPEYRPEHEVVLDAIKRQHQVVGSLRPTKRGVFRRVLAEPDPLYQGDRVPVL